MDIVSDVAHNPLGECPDDDEAVDSDAVLAPKPLLVRIAGRVLAHPAAPWVGVVFGCGNAASRFSEIHPGASQLRIIYLILGGSSGILVSLTLFSLRRVTRSDSGTLACLGLGSVKIQANDATRLHRWEFLVGGISLLLQAAGTMVF